VTLNSHAAATVLTAVTVFLTLPSQVTAACQDSPCTLEELVQEAGRSHPLVQAAREDLAGFAAKLKAARLTWLPSVKSTGLVSATPSKWGDPDLGGTDYSEWGPYVRFELRGVMPIYTFGRLSHLKKMAREGIKVGEAQVQMARARVELMVLQSYLGLQFSERVEDLLREGEKYLSRARSFLEDLEEEDSEDYDDVDMLRLKIYEAEVAGRRLDATRLGEMSLSALRLLTSHQPADLLPVPRLKTRQVKLEELDHYVDLAFGSRGELRALEGAMRAQGYRVTYEKRSFLPSFFVGAYYTYARAFSVEQQSSPFAYDPYNSWFGGAGLGLEFRLDPARQLAALDEARAGERKFAAQRRVLRQKIAMEVEKAYREARDLREKVGLSRTAHKAARGWALARLDLYESGMGNFKDLADGLGAFFKQRIAFEQVKVDHHLALARLAYACGTSYFALYNSE